MRLSASIPVRSSPYFWTDEKLFVRLTLNWTDMEEERVALPSPKREKAMFSGSLLYREVVKQNSIKTDSGSLRRPVGKYPGRQWLVASVNLYGVSSVIHCQCQSPPPTPHVHGQTFKRLDNNTRMCLELNAKNEQITLIHISNVFQY